jgi:hypothetical protein
VRLTFRVTVTVPDTEVFGEAANVQAELTAYVDEHLSNLEDELCNHLDNRSTVTYELQEEETR